MNLLISPNQLNRKRSRLQHYNYSQNGWYFVTLCTKDKKEFFGEVNNNEMALNEYGKIARKYWLGILEHYKSIQLDEFIIMPNHIHGIIVIENALSVGTEQCSVQHFSNSMREQNDVLSLHINGQNDVLSLRHTRIEQCSVPTETTKQYGLLSKIIKSYKETCVKYFRKNFDNYNFAWQRSFYDHIIRDEKSLNDIREYIMHNPLKWVTERNNKENLYY